MLGCTFLFGQIQSNPFKLENFPNVKKINLTSIDSWFAGSLNSPNIGKIQFTTTGFKGEKISHLNPDSFEYYLQKDSKKWSIKASTIFRSGQYEAKLKYPRVSHLGPYQVGIKLKSSLGKSIFLSEPKLFYKKNKINIVFILDNSGSMRVNDPSSLRLQAVLDLQKDKKFSKIINKVGVVIFGDNAEVLIPMTEFKNLWRYNKKITSIASRGKTDVPQGLKVAYLELMSDFDNESKVAILLTDGVSSAPTTDAHQTFKKAGIPLFTIGLEVKNSQEGFDQKYLKKIAKETGGDYFKGETKFLNSIYKKIATSRFNAKDKLTIILPKKKYRKNEYLAIYVKWLEKDPFDFQIKVDEIPVTSLRSIESGNWYKFYLKPLKVGKRKLEASIKRNKKLERNLIYLIEVKNQESPFSWQAQTEPIKLIPSQLIKEAVILHHQENSYGFYHLEAMHFINQKAVLPPDIIKFLPSFHLLKPLETKVLSIAYLYQKKIPTGMYSGNILIESDHGIFGFERELIVSHFASTSSKQNIELTKGEAFNLKIFILIFVSKLGTALKTVVPR